MAQYRKAKEEQEKAREGIVAKAIERIMKEQVNLFGWTTDRRTTLLT